MRLGCILSPRLFNLNFKAIIEETFEEQEIRVNGVPISNLRYADPNDVEELQKI